MKLPWVATLRRSTPGTHSERLTDEWTRTQRIRTAASIPVEAAIIDHADLMIERVLFAGPAKVAPRLGSRRNGGLEE